ncbi:hypothetical protein C8Q77DRAFT_590436 [Trametes polyzona]|nr:hypothetical protein C8Q77DRAFT_590436 [Trametes polyzona]
MIEHVVCITHEGHQGRSFTIPHLPDRGVVRLQTAGAAVSLGSNLLPHYVRSKQLRGANTELHVAAIRHNVHSTSLEMLYHANASWSSFLGLFRPDMRANAVNRTDAKDGARRLASKQPQVIASLIYVKLFTFKQPCPGNQTVCHGSKDRGRARCRRTLGALYLASYANVQCSSCGDATYITFVYGGHPTRTYRDGLRGTSYDMCSGTSKRPGRGLDSIGITVYWRGQCQNVPGQGQNLLAKVSYARHDRDQLYRA